MGKDNLFWEIMAKKDGKIVRKQGMRIEVNDFVLKLREENNIFFINPISENRSILCIFLIKSKKFSPLPITMVDD